LDSSECGLAVQPTAAKIKAERATYFTIECIRVTEHYLQADY
jgi:hypothetical protein